MAEVMQTHEPVARRGPKADLIDATMSAIATHGLSNLTSAKIAAAAGHTAASVNFHFGGKAALLLATLRSLAAEFDRQLRQRLALAGDGIAEQFDAIFDVSFDPVLSEPSRVAVWFAFLAEARARADYQEICGERDEFYFRVVKELCERAVANRPAAHPEVHTEAIAYALTGLIDQLWQEILFCADDYDRAAARQTCRAFVSSVFPWLRPAGPARLDLETIDPADADGLTSTLPSWIYSSEEFFALEREQVLLSGWQPAGHCNEIPRVGDYLSFEYCGERAFVIRDESGQVRAFHNVCRHRAHAVVTQRHGHCDRFLSCPYHGWTYHFDGSNRSVASADTFPEFERSRFGLRPLETEIFMGLIFVRFRPGGPPVARLLTPHCQELAQYRLDEMQPIDEPWEETHDIDWKNVVENYVEDYHFPTGHHGLAALMKRDYEREVHPEGVLRLSHRMREKPRRNWSAERYARILPEFDHLPADLQRRWSYFGLFPNVFLDVFPEWIDFFHVVPLGPGRVRLRSQSYGLPDSRREIRAARYLSIRINRRVQQEDNRLTRSVQQGLQSSAYQAGVLSSKEIVVKGFQDWLRSRIPVARLRHAPPAGTLADYNRKLS